MKKPALVIVVLVAITVVMTAISPRAFAQSALTDQQRDQIKANCTSIKNSLNQLKVSDALLRVNRGQLYESLSSKFMDAFNARLNSNGLDARGLVSVTSGYDTSFTAFYNDYRAYENQLKATIAINCATDPDAFHLAVENARTKRTTLHESVKKLHGYIEDYRSAVNDFKLNFERVAENN